VLHFMVCCTLLPMFRPQGKTSATIRL